MSTPLDKRGYVMSESDGQAGRYRLIIGFETLADLQDAHSYIIESRTAANRCPHGYELANLRDGTDTCAGCTPDEKPARTPMIGSGAYEASIRKLRADETDERRCACGQLPGQPFCICGENK